MDTFQGDLIFNQVFDLDIRMFLLLYETRSFSKTAQIVGCNQPAVSKRISKLEESLGITLFDRSQRPIRPTSSARILYSEMKNHAGKISDTIARLRVQYYVKPVLKFGSIETMSVDLAPEMITRLAPHFSQITHVTLTSNELVRQLLEHKLDIIISSDPFNEFGELHRRFLFQEPCILMMSRELAQSRSSWSWQDLQTCGKPFLHWYLASGGGRLNERYLSANYLNLPNYIEVDSNTVMASLVKNNVGWTICRASTFMQLKELVKGIIALPMPEPVLVRRIYMICRQSENKKTVDLCHEAASVVIRDNIAPQLRAIAPWSLAFFSFSDENTAAG